MNSHTTGATQRPEPFYNRAAELDALERAWSRPGGGQMALIYGRRRLGKTYLLKYFAAVGPHGVPRSHCYFLADQTTAATHRLECARHVVACLPGNGVTAEELAVSWNAVLRHVSAHAGAGERFILILDEFPYLVRESPELPSIIQAWWDRDGIHARLFVILCGSQLSSMAALGAPSAPLYGRFDAGAFLVRPLGYDDAALFYAHSPLYSRVERLTMYGVFGGTPRYHALVDTSRDMAAEITDLLLRPYGPLENEVQFLLGSEQIRDPAPYNAVLRAVASGATVFNEILNQSGTEKGRLSFYLSTLLDLGWLNRERPFGDNSDRRSIYIVADPFLRFWYRFIAPLSSERQFGDVTAVYALRIEPDLDNYMGRSVFEEICLQWLVRHALERFGAGVRRVGRYWSRDGRTEIDLIAELAEGGYLIGECRWHARSMLDVRAYTELAAKAAALPHGSWSENATFVLFSTLGFTPALRAIAAEPANRLALVDGADLLPM